MKSRTSLAHVAMCLLFGASLVGCKSTTFDDTNAIVDDDKAGTLTYDTMFNDVVDDLVTKAKGLSEARGNLVLAVMTVDSSARQELGREQREYLQEWLSNSLVNSSVFALISRNFMEVALNEAGVTNENQLLLPKYRRQFLAQLEGLGQTPDYLLFPSITASTSKSGGFLKSESQTTYQTTLKLVDVQTGAEVFSSLRKLPKSYSSWFGG